jgi:hypothetical protein
LTQDPFNIDMVYQTSKRVGSSPPFYMDNSNPEGQSRLYIGSNTNGLTSAGNGFWKCNDNHQVRINAQTPQTVNMDNSDGGCGMDYPTAELKGNAGMSDAWTNIEMGGTFSLTTFSPSDGRIILKGPTFHHHSNQICCSGHAYGVRFFLQNPLQIQFFKEIWHVNYFSRPDSPFNTKYGSIRDGNPHNLKFVVYTKTVNNIIGRQLEAYIDYDADGKDFVLLGSVIDLGGWGSGGGACNGKDDQILTWGSGWCMYRWDSPSTDLKFKNWTAREIDVTASPETTPTDPTDTRTVDSALVIPQVLSFDVNALRQNPCAVGGVAGGGGSGTQSAFYQNAINSNKVKELSNTSTFQNRKRIAVAVVGTLSDCFGQIPKTSKFALRKHNSPATNNIQAKIWNSANQVVYTSPTNIADSSLTTSFVMTSFDFSTNTHALADEDRIGVEYLGNSSSNYVEACYVDDIAGNNTLMDQYEGSSWDRKSREMCCELYPS